MSQTTQEPTSPPLTPYELLKKLDQAGARLELTTDREHLTVDAPAGTITPDIRAALMLHKLSLVALLRGDAIIPRLPVELEAMVRQAQLGQIQRSPEGVGDANRYVTSWASSWALQGDRDHVLERLWDVWHVNHPGEAPSSEAAARFWEKIRAAEQEKAA